MKHIRKTADQPCWTCKNYVDGCSWALLRVPVEGWKAKQRVIPYAAKRNVVTYTIEYCPEYEEGER